MIKLENLLFPVEKIENPEPAVSAYEYIVVADFDGDGNNKVNLNYCSSRYNLLPNINVFPVIETMLDNANAKYTSAYQMNNESTSFEACYIIQKVDDSNVGIDVGTGDKIYPTIIVGNSYSGLKQGNFTCGYYRMVCSNGLVIPLEGQEETNLMIKGKHTEKLNLSFDELLNKLHFFLNMQETFKERFETLADRMVPNYAERVIEVLNATSLKPSKDQIETINTSIINEANTFNGGVVSDWLVYNGINAHIFKGVNLVGQKSIADPDVKRKNDRKVLEYIFAN